MKTISDFFKKNLKLVLNTSLIAIFIFTTSLSFEKTHTSSDKILGTWLSSDKDLKVEIYKNGENYFGKVVWFACEPQTPDMNAFKDTENPNPALRNRKWLGMNVLEGLKFNNKGYWCDGKIYDPNSGHTFSTVVRLQNNETIQVKGYWGIELFGQTLTFNRTN